jgi:hypothetical protein
MAYRFVDPAPFMPDWGQRVMVQGRPAMHRVVTSRLQRRNNDVAIAFIHPLPQEQLNFEHVRDVLAEFLNVQMRMPYQAIQSCPFGQAYVTFRHMSFSNQQWSAPIWKPAHLFHCTRQNMEQ